MAAIAKLSVGTDPRWRPASASLVDGQMRSVARSSRVWNGCELYYYKDHPFVCSEIVSEKQERITEFHLHSLPHRPRYPRHSVISGRGKWKEIATLIPTRSTVQVKTHAQMIMKRVEAGDDVFAEFHESWPPIRKEFDVRHGFSVSADDYLTGPIIAVGLLEIYSSLSQMDQGAVHILYQMAQLRAMCLLWGTFEEILSIITSYLILTKHVCYFWPSTSSTSTM